MNYKLWGAVETILAPSDEGAVTAGDWGRDPFGISLPSALRATSLVRGRLWVRREKRVAGHCGHWPLRAVINYKLQIINYKFWGAEGECHDPAAQSLPLGGGAQWAHWAVGGICNS